MPTKPEPLNLGVPVVNFPRANAILARAQALLWVRDCIDPYHNPDPKVYVCARHKRIY
jgi:hypothetical protein